MDSGRLLAHDLVQLAEHEVHRRLVRRERLEFLELGAGLVIVLELHQGAGAHEAGFCRRRVEAGGLAVVDERGLVFAHLVEDLTAVVSESSNT